MKKQFIIAAAIAALFVSCKERIVIPEPTPVTPNLVVIDNQFEVRDFLHKTNAKTGCTFLESWDNGPAGYVPYMQCVGPDGKLKWADWLPLTNMRTASSVNKTVFDITTDGSVIDLYSAINAAGEANGRNYAPHITKILPDGTKAWGENGKLFYDFGEKSDLRSPVEGAVAADNNGGAWVVAGSPRLQLAIARIDADGNFVVKPILFDPANGASGAKPYIYRPQLMVTENNDVFVVVEYVDFVGSGSTDAYLTGYVDVIKISAEGQVLNQQTVIPECNFHIGSLARIFEDKKGGAYVSFVNGGIDTPLTTIMLYHFDSNGSCSGFAPVNLLPQGSQTNSMKLVAAIDPATGRMYSVLCDDQAWTSAVYFQTVDLNGQTGFEGAGVNMFADMPMYDHFTSMMYLIRTEDNRYMLSYVYNKAKQGQYLYKAWIDVEKGSCTPELVTDIDRLIGGDGNFSSTNAIINNKLRLFWSGSQYGLFYYDVPMDK